MWKVLGWVGSGEVMGCRVEGVWKVLGWVGW